MEDGVEIKKAVIPVAGLGTRFLPTSLAVTKEFFALADKPIIQYIVEEMKDSGIKEIVFVVKPKDKRLAEYFKKQAELEKLLTKRKREKELKELKKFEDLLEGISFSYVTQKNPGGDGHAILQAAKSINEQPFAVSFGDDVVVGAEPAIGQLINIFTTCKAPVLALKQMPIEKIPAYGSVVAEKIANRLYKIKKIIEKPESSQIQSNLVVVGKSVLTPEVFTYLKRESLNEKSEVILAKVIDKMVEEGHPVYGYEIKGEWLECGDKLKWLKSFFYTAFHHPTFGKELRDYLKSIK